MFGLRRLRATLAVDQNNIPVMLVRAKVVHAGLLAHPDVFPNPPIPVATLGTRITTLDTAQLATKARTGAASKRNVARDVLYSTLETFRSYVQLIADENPEKAATIIEDGGMKIAAARAVSKPALDARMEAPGLVVLRANATMLHKEGSSSKKRCFNWQHTVDGGVTWISMPSTPLAKTSISGLLPMTTYGFRVSVTDADGQQEWSQVVTLFVR